MTTVHDEQLLSHLDIVVLAHLSSAKSPSEETLAKDVAKLASPESPDASALQPTGRVLTGLRQRGLVNDRKLTEKGKRALRNELGVDSLPAWTVFRDITLAALGLGVYGQADSETIMKSAKSMQTHMICRYLDIPRATTLEEAADAVIRQQLDIPAGPVTLERIRAYALTRGHPERVEVGAKISLETVAAYVTNKQFGRTITTKKEMIPALGRRWLYEAVTTTRPNPELSSSRASNLMPPSQPRLPIEMRPPEPTTTPLLAVSTDTLLALVRETIPRIGSDGRFGKEKVFVSAIWHRLEHDQRLPDFSLDRFKRWLVDANREQKIDLARADLVGAMDPRLVRESEIEDLGATFHFVVDRRTNGTGQGHHAR